MPITANKGDLVMGAGVALIAADMAVTNQAGGLWSVLWAGQAPAAPSKGAVPYLSIGQLAVALMGIMLLSGLSEANDGVANMSLALMVALWILFIAANGSTLASGANSLLGLAK